MTTESFIATLLALLVSNAGIVGWIVRESFKRADITTARLVDHLQAQANLLIANNADQRREALAVNSTLQDALEMQRAEGREVGRELRAAFEKQRQEDREAIREHTEASKEIYRGMQAILAQLQKMNGRNTQ